MYAEPKFIGGKPNCSPFMSLMSFYLYAAKLALENDSVPDVRVHPSEFSDDVSDGLNPFRDLPEVVLNFRHPLLPIFPPDGSPSEDLQPKQREKLIKGRGKVPANKRRIGGWRALRGWEKPKALTDEQLARYGSWPAANMGIVLGRHPALPGDQRLICLDGDITDPRAKDAVEAVLLSYLGGDEAFLRYGNSEKVGSAFALLKLPDAEHSFRKREFRFDFGDGTQQKLEVLAEGQQSVIAGGHPTGVRYRWRNPDRSLPLCEIHELPVINVEDLNRIIDSVIAVCEEAGGIARRSAASTSHMKLSDGSIKLLTIEQALALSGALESANNTLERNEWVNFAKAYYLHCRVPLGEERARSDLRRFTDRWAGPRDPSELDRVLSEKMAPKWIGVPQIVRHLLVMLPPLARGEWEERLRAVEMAASEASPPTQELEPWMVDMNKKYAVLGGEGCSASHNILANWPDGYWSVEENKKIAHLHANDLINIGTSEKPQLVSKFMVWLKHPGRRTYPRGLRFLPGQPREVNGFFNTWNGWGIEPEGGSFEYISTHIRDVLCNADEASYEYVMNWLASRVQHPAGPVGTALVFRSSFGVGKGTFGKWLRTLFGKSCQTFTHARQVIGHFNNHLRDCNLIIAEEAFFAGDPTVKGPLKSLITDQRLRIEGKFLPSEEVDNHAAIIMFTNEVWAVPAEVGDRRFAIFDCSKQRAADYYDDLLEKAPKELSAFLQHLQTRDISKYRVSAFPRTHAHSDQVERSLSGVDRFLWNMVRDGAIPAPNTTGAIWGIDTTDPLRSWDAEPVLITKASLRVSLDLYMEKRYRSRPVTDAELKAAMERMGATTVRPNGKARCWRLPPRGDCTGLLASALGVSAATDDD